MEMKKNKLNGILLTFINLRKMGLKVSTGLYLDEFELKEMDEDLYDEGIFFTRRQVIDAINNNGFLFIKENNKEGILELELINQRVHHQRTSPDVIRVRLYKNELNELYELSKEIRKAVMGTQTGLELPE